MAEKKRKSSVTSEKIEKGEIDWMLAAAGNELLAEELRTGRCRCGALLADESEGCRWHGRGREDVARALRTWVRISVRDSAGPRGEDLDLLARFLPRDFLFCYEVLIHRGLVIPGSAVRGGRGYDETVDAGVGRTSGGLKAVRSGSPELNLVAGVQKKNQGSRKAVIRSDAAILYRSRIDRRLRKLAREMLVWLEEGRSNRTVRKCTGRRCGQFAEEGWNFCPNCGSPVDEFEKKNGRR